MARPRKAMEKQSIRILSPLKGGLRRRIFLSFAVQFGLVLGLVFSIVMVLDLIRMRRNFHDAQEAIAKSIVAKGKHHVVRTAMLLAALPENAFLSLNREIISATVASDQDIAYGLFLDADRKPLAFSLAGDSTTGSDVAQAFSSQMIDEMGLWASTFAEVHFRAAETSGKKVIEFAAPVTRDGTILGTIHFGVATESMNAALHATRQSWRRTKDLTISLFGLLGFTTFLMTIWSSSVLSGRITKPIRALTGSAIRIAKGDYRAKVEAEGEDEIAVLADAFETMREKVQGYTGDLQTRVDEKVRQVRDILDNVRQGLFTFNLDLNVNPDCSLSACRILEMNELAGHTLTEVLRLSRQDEVAFRDWVDVLLMHHDTHRWEKLAKLAPAQEIHLGAAVGGKQIKVEYQKILDTNGRLIKIMALVQDVTETWMMESRMREEKIRLENKVKTILGITSNPPELVSEFLKDSTAKIEAMEQRLPLLGYPLGKVTRRRVGSDGESGGGLDFASWIRIIYKDCHTIKGNAGAFGFEVLTESAHELESQLDSVTRGKVKWAETFPVTMKLIQEMKDEIKRMNEVFLLLTGNSEEVYVRLPEKKVSRIRVLAEQAGSRESIPELSALVECCKSISHRSFFFLTRKYQDLVARVALKTGKDVAFSISPSELELDPELLLRVDPALVHILRNAAVHGVEVDCGPGLLKEVAGKVELTYARTAQGHVFTVHDNGGGIDPDALVARAVTAGILDREAAKSLGEKDKLQLVFYPGLSTSGNPDSLSGRGMGLTIAQESVKALGGTITVESRPGLGSTFTIRVPL